MKNILRIFLWDKKGQTAVEYLLLLGVVVSIVLIGFKTYLSRIESASDSYYNRVGVGILGNANPCGDGTCGPFEDDDSCCTDCRLGGCGIIGPGPSPTGPGGPRPI